MVKFLSLDKPELVAVVLTGVLSDDEYDLIVPEVDAKVAQFDKINFYWEMAEDFTGWQPSGLWEDLKFDMKHANSFTKIAMVGDQKWQEWVTKLMNPLSSAEARFFSLNDRAEAMAWVQE